MTPAQRERERGFLFITGCKRSATEFLNHSIDSHPKLLNVVLEFYAFEYLERNYNLAAAIVDFAETAPVEEVYELFLRRGFLPCFDRRNLRPGEWPDPNLDDSAYFEMDFAKEAFFELFREARSKRLGSIAGLIKTWLACLKQVHPFNAHPEARWVLKCSDFGFTARGAQRLDLIDSMAFSVRHPVAILNSIKRLRMKERHRDFHIFELLEVCSAMEEIPALMEPLGSKVRVVRYEDFVCAPRAAMNELMESWGIGPHPALDRPTNSGRAVVDEFVVRGSPQTGTDFDRGRAGNRVGSHGQFQASVRLCGRSVTDVAGNIRKTVDESAAAAALVPVCKPVCRFGRRDGPLF